MSHRELVSGRRSTAGHTGQLSEPGILGKPSPSAAIGGKGCPEHEQHSPLNVHQAPKHKFGKKRQGQASGLC